jgi:hypothetical protein
MHTNTAMLRKFSWATNILFPEDLINKKFPTAVLLSELDDIVPSSAIEQAFKNMEVSVNRIIQMMRERRETHALPRTLDSVNTRNQKDLLWDSSSFDGVYAHSSYF